MQTARTIEVTRRDQWLGTRYRIADERGALSVNIAPDGVTVTSYGGSLWPFEFPDLFENLPSSASLGSGRVRVIGRLPA